MAEHVRSVEKHWPKSALVLVIFHLYKLSTSNDIHLLCCHNIVENMPVVP